MKSENTTGSCIYNADTLIVSGGTVSCNGYYGIYNLIDYDSGTTSPGITTISGGTINSAGSAIYNGEDSTVNISGGNINSEKYAGIYNHGTFTISDGNINSKGAYAIDNYENADLQISGGAVETNQYALYNRTGGLASINGGNISGGGYCIWNNGTLDISDGEITSTSHSVVNHGTLNISGGSFGTETSATAKYIANNKILNLSGSPVFNNTSIWLQTDDNIGITGALDLSEPCAVYINSAIPRIFTSGWSGHMSDKTPSDYFKSPYNLCTVAGSNGEVLLRRYIITFNANGGTCETLNTSINDNGNALLLPEAAKEKYTFDGWFTAEDGGDKITVDTVFTGDTMLYAHWSECNHVWGDTFENDDVQHWKVCTICGTEDDKANHQWDNGVTTKEPSEEETGIKTYTCTVCNAEKTEDIAPLGHTHNWSSDWSKNDTYHWHDCLNNCGEKNDEAAHIWNDGEVTKQPTANTAGEKTFECTVCGKTKTKTIPATGDPDDPDNGDISKEVQLGNNAPKTEFATPTEELIEAVLIPDDHEKIEEGIDIKIILKVENATENVPDEDKGKVETEINGLSDYKLGQYLDITLLKKIGEEQEQKITETNAPIKITFEIPENLLGKAEYSVIRVHDGTATVLRDLDSDPNTVMIETDKFSTYALTYKEKTTTSNPSGDNSSGGNSGGNSNPSTSTPNESDNSDATSSDDSNTTSSESDTSSDGSNHSPSEISPSEDNRNPSTGIAVSIIPLVTAAAILTVAVKRKKK